jgi:hypothetical protein
MRRQSTITSLKASVNSTFARLEAARRNLTSKRPISGAANSGCSRLSGGFFRRAQILSDESAISDPRATPAQMPETFPDGHC